MDKKKVYFSLNSDNKLKHDARTFPVADFQYLKNLDASFDLHIVHPREYNLNTMTVKGSYQLVHTENKVDFIKKLPEHEPDGDLFFIFSDGGAHNLGLDFMHDHYDFLKKLKSNGNFKHFFNEPEAEERTLKNYLQKLSEDIDGVAKTTIFSPDNFYGLLNDYDSVVLKPIAGCKSAGVSLLNSEEELINLMKRECLDVNYLINNYVLQEPLSGDEKRLLILDGKFLGSRVHINRKTPWAQNNNQSTKIYDPSDEEVKIAVDAANNLGTYLAGVDFIGSKVNEVNGSGTDPAFSDQNDVMFLNKVPEVLSHLEKILDK